MGLKYREQLRLSFDLCDVKCDVKLPLLLAYCMIISGKQSQQLGRSDAYVLDTYHLVWIITDHEFTFDRMPKLHETITIETEALSYNKYFCYRQFTFFDQDGQKMGTLVTHFALMDFDTRKVAPIPEELVAIYQSEFSKKLRRTPRLKVLNEAIEKDYNIRYYDIDLNGHVNNSKYLEWMYDVMGFDFLQTHRPKHIQVKYLKEVAPGGTVKSRYHLEELTSYHEITSENAMNAQAIMTWERITE